jgi:hypothetical protein
MVVKVAIYLESLGNTAIILRATHSPSNILRPAATFLLMDEVLFD